MNGFRLGASVLGVAAVVIFAQPVYAQNSAEQRRVEEIAKEITVYLEVPGTSGSGVLVNRVQGDNGDYIYTVLTAYHVVGKVRNNEEAYVTVGKGNNKEGKKHKLNTSPNAIRKLGNWDVAIAQFTSKEKYEVAAIGDSTKLSPNEEIYVAGFPLPSETVTETYFAFKSGSVETILSQPPSTGYQLIYDNQTRAGMSGGAVLNKNRELVAIHGETESNPNGKGRNLGIPTALFRDQLKPEIATPERQAMKAEDYFARGFEKDRKFDFQGAISDYNEAIRLNPNNALAYNNRGFAKYELEDKQGAISDYNEAIRLNSNYVLAYGNRAEAKSALGDKEGAIADYNEIIRLNSNEAHGYYGRGLIKKEIGEKQEALADFQKASELFQKQDTEWYNKSRDRIRELNLEPPPVPVSRDMKAEDYYSRGLGKELGSDFQGAIADYSEGIRIDPNYYSYYANPYNQRGFLKFALGDKQGALADYNEAIRVNPNAEAYYNRGYVKAELGDKQGALADFNEVIRIDPNYAPAYKNFWIDEYYLQDGQGTLADYIKNSERLGKHLTYKPYHVDAYYNRGLAKYDLGDKLGALFDYNEAIRINLILDYLERGVVKNTTIRINPNSANAYYNRGLIKKERGEKQEALADFRKASELYQKQGNTEWYNNALARIKELD